MTDQHLDLDVLADVLAGEAGASDATHARTCPACAAQLAALMAADSPVAAALARLDDPPLPPGLADRLDAALRRERRSATAPQGPDVVPLGSRRRAWIPWTGGIAAAAALVFAGVLLHGSSARDPAGHGAASSAAARLPSSGGVPTSSTGTNYRKDVASFAAAVPGLLRGAPSALDSGPPPRPASGRAATPSVADPLAALRTTPGLAPCLAAVQDPADTSLPLALDYAKLNGTPALVVVLRSDVAGKVDVFVVGAGCSAADAQLLYFTRVSSAG